MANAIVMGRVSSPHGYLGNPMKSPNSMEVYDWKNHQNWDPAIQSIPSTSHKWLVNSSSKSSLLLIDKCNLSWLDPNGWLDIHIYIYYNVYWLDQARSQLLVRYAWITLLNFASPAPVQGPLGRAPLQCSRYSDSFHGRPSK